MPFPIGILEPSQVPISHHGRASRHSATLTAPARAGWEPVLDRLGLWVLATVALIVLAYGPFFLTFRALPVSGGFRLF